MTDFYTCPSNTTETTLQTGTMQDPWKMNNINWLSITGGDELRLLPKFGADGFHERFDVGSSGDIDNYISIITAPGESDKSIIDGTVPLNGLWTFFPDKTYSETQPWVQIGTTEVWKKRSGSISYVLLENGIELTPRSTSDVENISRGEYSYSVDSFYYRSTDGKPPSTHDIRGTRRDLDDLQGIIYLSNSYINLDIDCKYFCPASGAAIVVADAGNINIAGKVSRCNSSHTLTSVTDVFLDAESHDNYRSGLMIEGNSSDIYITGSFQRNGKYEIFTGEISYIGDGDGIGIGGAGGALSNVTIEDVVSSENGPPDDVDSPHGSGIYLGTSNSMTVSEINVKKCRLQNNHAAGLFLNGQMLGGSAVGNHITGNGKDVGDINCVHLECSNIAFTEFIFANNVMALNSNAMTVYIYGDKTKKIINNMFFNNGRVGSFYGDLRFNANALVNFIESNNSFYREGTAWGNSRIISDSASYYSLDKIVGSSSGYWQFDYIGQGYGDIVADNQVLPNGKIQKTSPCNNTGTEIAGVNDGTQTDIFGHMCYGPPSIGVDWASGMPRTGKPKASNLGKTSFR